MENCYVLTDADTQQCAIVDPGMSTSFEQEQLFQYIEKQHITPVTLLITHAHIDHIAGLRATAEQYHLPVSMHSEGFHLLKEVPIYAQTMGFGAIQSMDDIPTHFLEDGAVMTFGSSKINREVAHDVCVPRDKEIQIEARYVPGHCPGSLCFVVPGEEIVLTGDALFRGSIGRTDLPGGDYNILISKIRSRILSLPGNYEILPGHGDVSTIDEELLYNPFLSAGI